MNISNGLTKVVEQALPALSGSKVTYNKQNNIYLSDAYTSAAGNTYFQGIRLSNRIIISYYIGQGYAHTFLNGVRIYGFDGNEKKLIASRSFSCEYFTEEKAKNICISMITNYLQREVELANMALPADELSCFANKLIAETLANNPSRLLQ